MSQAVAGANLRYTAPASLRERIEAALPTLKYAVEQGAKVVWRNDSGAADKICPADKHKQRPD